MFTGLLARFSRRLTHSRRVPRLLGTRPTAGKRPRDVPRWAVRPKVPRPLAPGDREENGARSSQPRRREKRRSRRWNWCWDLSRQSRSRRPKPSVGRAAVFQRTESAAGRYEFTCWRGRDGNDPSVDIAKDADQRFEVRPTPIPARPRTSIKGCPEFEGRGPHTGLCCSVRGRPPALLLGWVAGLESGASK